MQKQYPYYRSLRWRWSEDFGCYIDGDALHHPDMYGLGNKILYWQDGKDTYKASLRGSSSEHWGGWYFDHDLKRGLDWMKEVNE